MFQTLEGAELASPAFRLDTPRGTQSWAYVVQSLELPWFHVQLGFGPDSRVVFASHVSNWVHLPRVAGDDRLRLVDVRLVSPSWLNGTGHWLMEPLEEVFEGRAEGGNDIGWVFVVATQKRYSQPPVGAEMAALTRLKRIYRSAMPTEPDPPRPG